MTRIDDALAVTLNGLAAEDALVVAFSGGLDSTVLLHAAWRWSQTHRRRLRAMHINHQLQPAAADFQQQAEQICRALPIDCQSIRVKVIDEGEGIEAAARKARYHALAEHTQPDECIVLAHHADDQIETFLLQLFRGAGLKGLSAMPTEQIKLQRLFLRPLLTLSRAELEQYATEHQLRWIDDPTNADLRFRRNWLRQQLLPMLRQHYPGIDQALARVVEHCQQAQSLIDELAESDLAAVQRTEKTLSISRLLSLSAVRQSALLRYWLSEQQQRAPNQQRLQDFLAQLSNATDRTECCYDGICLRVAGDALLQVPENLFRPIAEQHWQTDTPLFLESIQSTLQWRGMNNPEQPLRVSSLPSMSTKLSLAGESHRRTLKYLMQQLAVPVWLRAAWPCVWHGEQLLALPGLLVTAEGERFLAEHQGEIILTGPIADCWQALQTPDALS